MDHGDCLGHGCNGTEVNNYSHLSRPSEEENDLGISGTEVLLRSKAEVDGVDILLNFFLLYEPHFSLLISDYCLNLRESKKFYPYGSSFSTSELYKTVFNEEDFKY